MKVKMFKLVESRQILNKLVNQNLPITISFRIGVVIPIVNQYLKVFEDNRQNLVKEFASPPDKDGNLVVKEENREIFDKKIASLLEEEVEMNFVPIPIVKFEGSNVEMSPIEMVMLDWLIVDDLKVVQ